MLIMNKQAGGSRLYWSLIAFGDSHMHIAETERGLCYAGALGEPFDEMAERCTRRFGRTEWIRDDERMKHYGSELAEYADGNRSLFEGKLDLRGTPFQLRVWKALLDIPFGETRSYADIAKAIDSPSAVRAAGTAIGANPVLVFVPCHRVIGKNGALSGYRGGLPMKKLLLELEDGAVHSSTGVHLAMGSSR
ncbi:methylated-DNA--[protein]-cysteine S-methyltransferase [Paenibacillus sp. PAMC21692]|uniref:methylated-DNA--[protein]-cysteine S-methyltransferase n=1 Tax=Paenibacillus sp. PAMC21692 TaxID=2762320 RepID=UPI0037C9BA13